MPTDTARNGKIAHLPRSIRDQLNQRLASGQSAVFLMRWLNKLPEVKQVLKQYFHGRPLNPQNLSEWRNGGFRAWQLQQEALHLTRERAADAMEYSQIADSRLADAAFNMITLRFSELLKNWDGQVTSELTEQLKLLSSLARETTRLRQSDQRAKRIQLQADIYELEREKTDEEIFDKFVEWIQNPDIRACFILAPLESMRRMRKYFGMPPAAADAHIEAEVKKNPRFRKSKENQTEINPNRDSSVTESFSCSSPSSSSLSTSEKISPSDNDGNPPTVFPPGAPAPGREGQGLPRRNNAKTDEGDSSEISNLKSEILQPAQSESSSPATPKPGEGGSPSSSLSPLNDRNNHSIERKRSGSLAPIGGEDRGEGASSVMTSTPQNSTLATPHSEMPSPSSPPSRDLPHLNDYERALAEGKTFLEALYIAQSPAKNKPTLLVTQALDSFSENTANPPRYRPMPQPSPYGPAPAPFLPSDGAKVII